MKFRFAVLGLVAAVSLSALSIADEQDPTQPNREKSAMQDSATQAEPAAESIAETSAESAAQPMAAAAATDEAVPEMSLEEAAAAAGNIEGEHKPFDPNKAKPAEIEAYNANVGADDKIICRRERSNAAVTGSRFGQRICRSVREWRNAPK